MHHDGRLGRRLVTAVVARVRRCVDVPVDVVLHERHRVRFVDAEAALETHLFFARCGC